MSSQNIGTVIGALCLACSGFVGVSAEGRRPPKSELQLPSGPLGETIRLGRDLVERTTSHELSKPYVGNALNCTSCHLKNGTDAKAASFIGVAAAYPAWSPREQRVITLEDRILNCFMRSCNGIRPPLGSKVSVSIAAYITWLSSETPIRMNAERPAGPNAVPALPKNLLTADAERGAAVYSKKCSSCHGDDGQGDETYPPLWGKRSFNDGAGLAEVGKLAAWVKVAMPPGAPGKQPDEAELGAQEALDVAAFVNRHDRPKFRLADHLPARELLGEFNTQVKLE